MRKVAIELMTVTPLFLGGSDPRSGQPPELRPPSFRGAMRYWYRAALGGVVGDKNLDAVRALEEAVFGSTDSGSPISLRISGNLKWSLHSILPHKSAGRRNAFDPGQTFRLTMSARPTCPDLIWANACMALNLALTLGGVGLRSRRGMGSLQVVKSSDPLVPVFPNSQSQIEGFIRLVTRSAIRQVETLANQYGYPAKGLPDLPTEFPSAAMNAEIQLSSQINARNGVEAVADLMRRFPKQSWLGGIEPRQASPVWARVFKTTEGYHLLFTLLPAKLAGNTHNYTELRKWLKMGNVVGVKGWNQ